MRGKYLLDTNVVIAFLNGDEGVAAKIEACGEIALPVIVLGELLYGVLRSSRHRENKRNVLAFASRCRVIWIDDTIAEQYAQIRARLARKGRPIPENDIWIAASALSEGATLVSEDQHFLEIDELACEAWA